MGLIFFFTAACCPLIILTLFSVFFSIMMQKTRTGFLLGGFRFFLSRDRIKLSLFGLLPE